MRPEQTEKANKSGKTKVSVVIPVYNVENYLDASLASVTEQTFSDLEIILIDDGSTDDSGEKCEKWRAADDRITVFHQENRGLSAARNLGVRKAAGHYIVFVDSDDVVEPDYVEKLYHAVEAAGADMAVAFIERTDRAVRKRKKLPVIMSSPEAMDLCLKEELPVNAVAKIYTKECIRDLQFVEGMVYEDNLYAFQVIEKCRKIAAVNEILYHHNIRGGSITETHALKHLADMKKSMELIRMFLCRYYPEDEAVLLYKEITDWLVIERMLGCCIENGTADPAVLADIRNGQKKARDRILAGRHTVWGFRKRFGFRPVMKFCAIWLLPGGCYDLIKLYKWMVRRKRWVEQMFL